MWKVILAGTSALAVVGASLVYAQQTPPAPGGRDSGPRFNRDGGFRFRTLSPEDRAALTDARIAGLKAGLKLTPDQEKNWPAVESALRERAKVRAERFEQFRKAQEQRRANPDQRRDVLDSMKTRADEMAAAAASLKKLTEAIDPLYKSLDESQKQRFALLYREGGHEGHGHHWFRGNMGPGMGPGFDNAPQPPNRSAPGRPQRRTENEL